MARAEPLTTQKPSLYERDFYLWLEQQALLLREGRLDELDVANLLDEIESMGNRDKKSIKSNLVVVLKHFLKYQFQPRRRSRSWLSSIAEHRRRLRDDLEDSPSLRGYAREQLDRCYQDARRQALIETALAPNALPGSAPYTLEQTLDPDFLPDQQP